MKVVLNSNTALNTTLLQDDGGGRITISSAQGPTGAQGVQGTIGSQGVQGVQGVIGITVSYVFDGGAPINNYSAGPAFDCGGVT